MNWIIIIILLNSVNNCQGSAANREHHLWNWTYGVSFWFSTHCLPNGTREKRAHGLWGCWPRAEMGNNRPFTLPQWDSAAESEYFEEREFLFVILNWVYIPPPPALLHLIILIDSPPSHKNYSSGLWMNQRGVPKYVTIAWCVYSIFTINLWSPDETVPNFCGILAVKDGWRGRRIWRFLWKNISPPIWKIIFNGKNYEPTRILNKLLAKRRGRGHVSGCLLESRNHHFQKGEYFHTFAYLPQKK